MRAIYALVGVLLGAACGDNGPGGTLDLDDVELATAEDTPLNVEVPFTATDKSKAVLQVTTAPMHGAVTGTGPRWTYTPAENYFGPDTFVVEATEKGKSVTARVTIDVTAVNDAPIAKADSFPAGFETPLPIAQTTLLANDTDVEASPLSVTNVTAGTHGVVTMSGTDVVFTPEAGYTGTATFKYTVSDGGATGEGAVTITIGDDMAPVAVDDTAITNEDIVLTLADSVLLANDTDAEGHTLAITAVSAPTNGAVSHTSTTTTFTPAANFHGTASFTYTVSDGIKTDTGLVTITVVSVNDAPVAVDDSVTLVEDHILNLTSANLTANDTDVDGDTLAVTAVQSTAATHGTVTLVGTAITYTPASNYNGTASFTYTVSDGNGGTDTGTVTITITGEQDAPVANADTITTNEDVPITFAAANLTANDNDPDGDTLTVTAVTANANTHGTVVLAAGNVTYSPALNYNGPASFTYTINDGNGNTATGTVNVTVNAVDDPPAAVDDLATVAEASANNVINVLVNDTDVDTGPKTVTAVGAAAHGTAAIGGGGANVTYTPAAGYCNEGPNVPPDSFTYTLNGGSQATVRVTVTCACGLGKPTTFVVGGL
jgi:hypothetical protein